MNQEFIYEMQQILNELDEQTPSMIIERFITTIGNKELSILNGEITSEEFSFLITLVNENLILNQKQKVLLVESLNISIKNAEIATQLRQVMADGAAISLRPILILNMHNDPAMYMLLTDSIADLVKKGYRIIVNEDVSDEHLSEEEWNKECDKYLQNLSKKEQEYLKLSSLNTEQILELFAQATEDFKNDVEHDSFADFQDKEQIDQFDKELQEFTLKCNSMVYERRYHTALSSFRLENPGQNIITENFDSRSISFGTEEETNLLLHLSNIGFALQIALKSYVMGGAVLIVGLAHGQGICNVYGKLFPQLLQPLNIIPCHYAFTKETPAFISDSFRHKQHIIKEFLQSVQHMEYAIIDMALYTRNAAKHFVQIVADQKICEENRLKLFDKAAISEVVSTTASSSSSALAVTSCDDIHSDVLSSSDPFENVVDTINISYAIRGKSFSYMSCSESSFNNLRSKFALLLDYKRILKKTLFSIEEMGQIGTGGWVSIIKITVDCCIAGNTYTFDLKEAMTKRLQMIESGNLATAHIEELPEESSSVDDSFPVEPRSDLITPAFQLTTVQQQRLLESSEVITADDPEEDDDLSSHSKCQNKITL